jgi:hypothetical protein
MLKGGLRGVKGVLGELRSVKWRIKGGLRHLMIERLEQLNTDFAKAASN